MPGQHSRTIFAHMPDAKRKNYTVQGNLPLFINRRKQVGGRGFAPPITVFQLANLRPVARAQGKDIGGLLYR